MAWGKVKQFFSRNRMSSHAEVPSWWFPQAVTCRDDSGWELAAMHYTPQDAAPGNHP